ncbi:hypothetical protein ATCC90586_000320 [Pythium insidiosum]|nr:hypothetical protein ATCC90586_000320 [Pythium insidiosum]
MHDPQARREHNATAAATAAVGPTVPLLHHHHALHSSGVRRRSSVPLSTVLEVHDDSHHQISGGIPEEEDDAGEEAQFLNDHESASLLGQGDRRSSSAFQSSRRRSSQLVGSAQRRTSVGPAASTPATPLVGSYLLYTTVLITVLLGPQLGWEIAQLNLGVFHNTKDCRSHPVPVGRCIIYPGHTDVQWVFAVMCWVLGAAVGSLFCSVPSDRYGRRAVVVGNAVCMIVGGALQTFSPTIYLFALGRFFNGVASGAGSTITSLFLGEIGPPQQKAGFVVAFQCTGSVGLMAITLVHYAITGSPTSWRWIMAFPMLLGLVQLTLAPAFLVESPKWLLHQRRKKDAAVAFHRLYKSGSFQELEQVVKSEIEKSVRRQIQAAQSSETGQAHAGGFWRDAFSSRCYKQFTISCVLCVARQFGGVSAVFYYSSGIFASAGIKDTRLGNVVLSAVNLMAVGVVCFSMKRLPRRTALLGGIGGMVICSIGMTIALVNNSIAAVPLTALYVGCNSLSLNPLPFLVTAEVLPEHIKAQGISFTTFINWFCNLIVGIVFPVIAHYTGNYTFVPFTVLLSVFWVCTYVMLPETKNRTVEQIQQDFNNIAGFLDKLKKAKALDDEQSGKTVKDVELGLPESATATVATVDHLSVDSGRRISASPMPMPGVVAASRRTSTEFVMQPPRPNISRTA